ncbi:hypothetical protein D3C85_1569960 [compost metagenome]
MNNFISIYQVVYRDKVKAAIEFLPESKLRKEGKHHHYDHKKKAGIADKNIKPRLDKSLWQKQ